MTSVSTCRLPTARLFAVTAFALLIIAGAPVAYAHHPGGPSGSGVEPTFEPGNPTCQELSGLPYELRINSPGDGVFSDGFLSVTLDTYNTGSGQAFDWSSNLGVDDIFVKGGPAGNLYSYNPEATGDTGLHSPVNHKNGKYYGLSHISFCYDIVPSVDVVKGGDPLSKVGDDVTYDFTITNDGDIALSMNSVSDTLLGDLTATASANGCGSLAISASCSFSVTRTVQSGDSDPLPNTVTVSYDATLPDLSTETVGDTDNHSVNLFQPSVSVSKVCASEPITAGDTATWNITITNASSDDSPNLVLDGTNGIIDSIEGNLTSAGKVASCSPLGYLGSCNFSVSKLTTKADIGELNNTVSVLYHPAGFPNDIGNSSSDACTVVAPAPGTVIIEKVTIGGDGQFDYTGTNPANGSGLSTAFSLNTSSNFATTAPNFSVETNFGVPTVYTVDESGMPSIFWLFQSLSCVEDGTQDTTISGDVATIRVDSGETVTCTYTNELPPPEPGTIIIEKVTIGGDGQFDYTGTGGGGLPTAFSLNTVSGFATTSPNYSVNTAHGVATTYTVDESGMPAGWSFVSLSCSETGTQDTTTSGTLATIKVDSGETVTCTYTNQIPLEGCTPGYWRNHLSEWGPTGYTTGHDFDTTFGVDLFDPNINLGVAINLGGGGVKKLARHGTAALLAAAHPGVDYPMSVAEVIAAVQAGDAATLAAYNELGCPLN